MEVTQKRSVLLFLFVDSWENRIFVNNYQSIKIQSVEYSKIKIEWKSLV